jgi:hypothetical protein
MLQTPPFTQKVGVHEAEDDDLVQDMWATVTTANKATRVAIIKLLLFITMG